MDLSPLSRFAPWYATVHHPGNRPRGSRVRNLGLLGSTDASVAIAAKNAHDARHTQQNFGLWGAP